MRKEYIYLDWNVIQYAKNPRQGRMDETLAPLIKRLSKKYRIPYSEAHLRDLASGFSDKTRKYVYDDLEFLPDITKSDAIVFLRNEQNGQDSIGIQPRNCKEDFASILSEIKNEENIDIKFFPSGGVGFSVDISMLDQEDVFLESLKNNNGELNSSVISQVLQELWDNQNNPDFYKRFRRQVQKVVEHLEARPNTLINESTTARSELAQFFKYLSLEKEEEIEEIFLPALAAFAKLSGRDFERLSTGEKMDLAYSLLDFQPIFSEKVNKKNRPSNQLRDLKHFLSAANARIFVTEDAGSLGKSRLVIRALGMRVKALNVSEFIARFS
ncbi:hypothetical protein [Paraburkholderia bannensis]|uniref:hypothetical protein n=1 Tax=Paraburkholderia bannensis TaxID=765414 RepID=UPI002ABD7AC9|nr:hypothetical protein [Paraburkholderia bannensis]